MVRTPYVDENGMRKGAWSSEEDDKLRAYIQRYGHWNWRLLPEFAGLARSGKSCRLRWMNYLKPGLKRGNFTQQEEDQIINLHGRLGKKWSAMALEMPGRTDNEIKNFWYGHIAKRNGKRTIPLEEEVINSDMLVEYCEVPKCQAIISTIQNEELVSLDTCVLGTDSAEAISSDFWTTPFELDTDSYGEDSQFTPFLEEDLLFLDVNFNGFSNFDYVSNLY